MIARTVVLPHLGLWPPLLAILVPFVVGVVAMPAFIGVLATRGMGQRVRQEGPRGHLAKGGTPTAGGLAVLGLVLLTTLLIDRSTAVLPALAAMLLGGLLGLADDIVTVSSKGAERGLRARQKIVVQLVFGLLLGWWFLHLHQDRQLFPFSGHWKMGWLLLPAAAVAFVAATNAFNLTDGSDGLAPGVSVVVLLAIALVARHLNHHHDVALVRLALAGAGALMAFLVYNVPPARVFLGGVGSEGIGMLVAALSISTGLLWLLPVLAIVPVVETLSVIVQVSVFKRRGRRVLRMSPLHHHFHLSGWSEWRVAGSAWGVTAAAGTFTYLLTRSAV